MSIRYVGKGLSLTPTRQVLVTVDPGVQTANLVHVQVTNLDSEYQRPHAFHMEVIGSRYLRIVDHAEVEFGVPAQFSGITLGPDESIRVWADSENLLVAVASVGEQR